jgi:SAM-dependent methyltransferase
LSTPLDTTRPVRHGDVPAAVVPATVVPAAVVPSAAVPGPGHRPAAGPAQARYDGFADWYDTTFRNLADDKGSTGLLARLLGPATAAEICLDIGCGTGLHAGAPLVHGYTLVGVDVSADQLRIAANRNPRVIQADARALPVRDASVAVVVMTFIHTDVDDFPAAVAEAVRVLRPGGRLVYLGLHPAYIGAFLERGRELEEGDLRLAPGYGDERLWWDPTGRYPIRSRVGSRNLTLATFLGAFLAQERLRLESFLELDTAMQPWSVGPADGRVVPWNLALTARVADAYGGRH